MPSGNDLATPASSAAQPLTIAVDLFPLIPGVSGGIVPWIEGVLREMVRLYPGDRVMLFHRPGACPIDVDGDRVRCLPLDAHPVLFYEQMTRHCEREGVQAVIRSYPQEQHPAIAFERQIFTIPDIQHDHLPENFARSVLAVRRRAFAYALSCGGAVATMTEHSRSTVTGHPWTMTDDVFLMPAALTEELRTERATVEPPSQVARFDRYFYFPANLWPHKNHRRLFEALRLALPDLPARTGLVLTGNAEGLAAMLDGFEDLPILHLGYVTREQVAALFQGAEALVYFSLFEGFGMPLLEAFHHGVPVLCSNTTSLPEVGGDAVLACDPADIDAMAVLMRRIVTEPGLREALLARAPGRLAAYDWAVPARALRAGLERRAAALPRPARRLRVSLVMPTRNHAEFIRRSIDSVLKQGYPDLELLVVDGASSDGTIEILNSYGDRIKWLSEPDTGQSDAINKGMGRVTGDILGYLNSDDILLPDAIEKVVAYFAGHPECDMVYGDADFIDRGGCIIGAYPTAGFSFERLMSDCCVCQPAAFWRRRASERTGPFSTDLQTAMDYEYWLRLASDGAIIHHCADKWAQSRLHEGAKTLTLRGTVFKEVFAICRAQGGYVSYGYHNGLWSYRLYESWRGGPVLRRFLPWVHRVPALAQFGAQALGLGNRVTRAQVARTLFRAIDQRHPRFGGLVRRAWGRSSLLRRSLS
ncbi:glycosyltransferase [Devosia sp.]|uniref:glycosyltransferase n=1 Tax=Devosia sp. TaxID=1871048 RepID=UPI0035B02CAE